MTERGKFKKTAVIDIKFERHWCGHESENSLGSGMGARNLAELCFIIAHQEVDAILCSVFNVRHLFADAAVDNVLRGNTMALDQFKLRLKDKYEREQTYILRCCKTSGNFADFCTVNTKLVNLLIQNQQMFFFLFFFSRWKF